MTFKHKFLSGKKLVLLHCFIYTLCCKLLYILYIYADTLYRVAYTIPTCTVFHGRFGEFLRVILAMHNFNLIVFRT